MKVILIQDVKDIGKAGQTVTVKDGHATNYLIPRGLASVPGSSKARMVQKNLSQAETAKRDQEQDLQRKARNWDGKVIQIPAKVGANNKLFGSVTSSTIAEALGIDKQYIRLGEPLRQLGSFPVTLHFGPSIEASIEVRIVSS